MTVTYQAAAASCVSDLYSAIILARAGDIVDLELVTQYGSVEQVGVPVVADRNAAGANTCWISD